MTTPTVESLKKELDELRNSFGKELDSLRAGGAKKVKTKRGPSAFNLYMKERIPQIKSEHPELSHNEAFKMSAGQWKDRAPK
jgi:hypothetical protein